MRFKKLLAILNCLGVLFLLLPNLAHAADSYCFCGLNLTQTDVQAKISSLTGGEREGCQLATVNPSDCTAEKSSITPPGGLPKTQDYIDCTPSLSQTDCKAKMDAWDASFKNSAQKAQAKSATGVSAFIPACIMNGGGAGDKNCENLGIFITLGINVGRFLFGIIGALALLMFIYGGFTLILSQGSPEKVKKGTGIMIAAVTGIIVAFGGYLAIRFLGQVIGVSADYLLL